jgi:LPS-assembly protein
MRARHRLLRHLVLCVCLGGAGMAAGQYVRPDLEDAAAAEQIRPVRTSPASTAPVPVPSEPQPSMPADRSRRDGDASPADATSTNSENASAPAEDDRIVVDADSLEYDADRRLMIGRGNVEIRQFGDVLRADYVEVHRETRVARAQGNVYFERGGEVWEGDELTYNLRTREGDFGEFEVFTEPFYISAEEATRSSDNVVMMRKARVTTCAPEERQEFAIRFRRASLTDGTVLRAHHASVWLYGVPLFYVPYWKKDFVNRTHIDVMPGYSSRMGPYVLTGYRTYPAPGWRTSTHLDYRADRGVGVGQTVRWRLPEAQGRVHAYYADDDEPIRGAGEQALRDGLVDNERYWLGFRHNQPFGLRNTLWAELNYVSDPFVLEDFFDDEFRARVQPENRVALTHRGDAFTAGLLLQPRLNDFYENVNRLPEASLDVNRQRIGETPLYYESQTAFSALERVYAEGSTAEDYEAVRFDTLHRVIYPTRQFGFLSVVPSAAYRATWYSATPDVRTTLMAEPVLDDEGNPVLDAAGDPVLALVESNTVFEGSADIRSLFEFKLDTSYKAFKVLSDAPNYLGTGLRHVAEPYAEYTLVPEPNLVPGELYQFDDVDQLDRRNDVRIGVRNKLQTKRRAGAVDSPLGEYAQVHDFIDIDTYTTYRLDPREPEEDFGFFNWDARLRLADWNAIDFEGAYDWYESEPVNLSTRLRLIGSDDSSAEVEYRYDRDRRESVIGRVNLFPDAVWSLGAYWRFNIEDGDLEEHSYMVQRRLDCTRLGIGVRSRLDDDDEEDWRVWAQVTLLAFPDSGLQLGR